MSPARRMNATQARPQRKSLDLPAGADTASDASTSRLSLYLRALARCELEGQPMASSDDIARATGVKPALVRKDLAHFGQFGIRGVGYEVRMLRTRITTILGLNRDHNVVIVGAGNLGMALADSRGFNTGGFRTVALIDSDPKKVGGRSRGGVPIVATRELPAIVRRDGVEVAALAVPAENAQKALEQIAAAGVRAVLNFVPTRLKPPRNVNVRSVDLKIHLEGLAYWLARTTVKRRSPAAAASGAGAR